MAAGAAALAGGPAMAQSQGQQRQAEAAPAVLPLEQFQPKSMLHAKETHVARARFPLIDFHTHITFVSRQDPEAVQFSMQAADCLKVMDRKNIRTMVDLTGGYGKGVREAIHGLSEAHPGRFVVFTEPAWTKASDPGYAKTQADLIEDAHKAGARGLKVLKTLGLFLRERGSNKLVRVDDPRFDPMWEAVGALKMPVAIHTSDPEAFFLPIDRFNERWEELHAHPDWSFHGRDYPRQPRAAGSAAERDAPASAHAVRMPARGRRRRPGLRFRVPGRASEYARGHRRADRGTGTAAAGGT